METLDGILSISVSFLSSSQDDLHLSFHDRRIVAHGKVHLSTQDRHRRYRHEEVVFEHPSVPASVRHRHGEEQSDSEVAYVHLSVFP